MARKEHHPGEEEKNDSAEKETYGAEIESASNARRFSNNSVTGNRHNTLPSRSGPPHVKSANRGGVVKSRGDRIQMEPTISSSVSSHRAPSPAAASIVPVPVQPHTYRSSSVTTRSNPVNSQAAYNQTAPHHPGRRATHVSGMDGDSIYVELSQLKHEQVQLRRSLEQIRTERDTLVERLKESDMLREDAEALCTKVQSLMDENMQLEKKLCQILSERNAAQSYLQRQTEETAQFRSQCHKLEETVECNKISMSSKDTKLTELEEKVQELQGKLRDQKIKLEEEEATVGHLRMQLRQATEEVDSLRVAKLAAESVQEELLSTIREQQELEHERVSSRQRTHVEHELNASTAVENCGKLEVVLDECRSLREQMAEIQKLLPQCMERGIEKAMYRKENSETAELRVRIEELVGLLSVSEAARKLATSELRLSRAIVP